MKRCPYSQSILNNTLCLFLQEFVNLKVASFDWLDGLSNQRLCYFQLLLNIDKSG